MEGSSIRFNGFRTKIYYHNEIQQGYGGIGSYTLFSRYAIAAIPLDEVMTSTVISPEEIMDQIKNNQLPPIPLNLL